MTISTAYAQWVGDLHSGSGSVSVKPGCGGSIDLASRVDRPGGLTPEGLIGGGLAACFSMALAHALTGAGHSAQRIETEAEVAFERQGDQYAMSRIHLSVVVVAEGTDESDIRRLAEETQRTCPVARALTGVPIDHTLSIHPPTQIG